MTPPSSPIHRLVAVVIALGFLSGVTGCFKSLTLEASSESSSDSSSSPFESSSDSSSPDDEVAEAVGAATANWALRSEDLDALRRDVGQIAASHGVTDWEQHAATYRGIGEGLRRSELGDEAVQTVKNGLATGHPQALTWINAGYYAQVN